MAVDIKPKFDKAAKRQFLDLVEDVNSPINGVRVSGRIRMNAFVIKYGRDVCDEFYKAYNERAAARKKS